MFSRGLKGSIFTFSSRSVIGVSCMRPRAPARDCARGLKFDSVWITARTRSALTS
jgi:hypothetical protein